MRSARVILKNLNHDLLIVVIIGQGVRIGCEHSKVECSPLTWFDFTLIYRGIFARLFELVDCDEVFGTVLMCKLHRKVNLYLTHIGS